MNKSKTLLRILITIFILANTVNAQADTTRRSPSEDGTFTAGPYYNSATGSYFELIRNDNNSWNEAEIVATNHSYKNTAGRLAIIDRPETHRFLVKNFAFLQETWIGLRFFCEQSSLIWSDGIGHRGNTFSNWSPTSTLQNLDCPLTGYLYTFINANAFDWTLGDLNKSAQYILIEYPTGRR